MVNISRTLKKSTFLVWQPFLGLSTRALGGPICVFYMDDLGIMAQKISKNGGNMKIFLESCKETSKLSRNIFWGRWDHIVAQKSIFKIFFFEKPINSCNPPPVVSYLRVIALGQYRYNVCENVKLIIILIKCCVCCFYCVFGYHRVVFWKVQIPRF